MSLKVQRIRARARFGLRSLAIGSCCGRRSRSPRRIPTRSPSMSTRQSSSSCRAKVATIVVGNPLIADVTCRARRCPQPTTSYSYARRHLQGGGVVVVTGKGYGATNFIAMDRAGDILVDRLIQVEGPMDQIVTVYRGIDRESYSCMPICQRRITLGDGDKLFQGDDRSGRLAEQPGQRIGRGRAPGQARTEPDLTDHVRPVLTASARVRRSAHRALARWLTSA